MGEIPGSVGIVRCLEGRSGRLARLGGPRADDAVAQVAGAGGAAQGEHQLEVGGGAKAGGPAATDGCAGLGRRTGIAGCAAGGIAGRYGGAHLTHLFAVAGPEDCRAGTPYDALMTTTGGGPLQAPGDRPPKRLLERPPSERLADAPPPPAAEAPTGSRTGSPARALVAGLAAAAAGVAVHVAAATLLLWTGALLVVAVTVGIVVGLAVAVGGGAAVRASTRRTLAVVLAVAAVAVAVGVNWAASGMYLGPLDYVVQVYGLLVPAQIALAAAGALAGSR